MAFFFIPSYLPCEQNFLNMPDEQSLRHDSGISRSHSRPPRSSNILLCVADHWPSMPLSRAASPFEYPPAGSSCQASGRSTPVSFYSASSRELQGANDGLRNSHKVMSSFGATPLSAMPPPVYTGYSPLSEGQSVWQMPQATGGWVQFGVNGGVAKQQERSSAASN